MSLAASDAATLASWDAVETAARIRAREVTAREVLEAAIARMEEATHLGAVVTPTLERARAQKSLSGAFAGVPTFIKDLAQLEGVETTWGSRGSGHYVSRKTDPFVRRFEETGVVVLGKSATPELGLTATTEPLGRAPCRNPWDPSRSSGGSSGGAASLVASGVAPLAHGSDGGGSIRIPAACCGLVGLKPSRFRLDMEGSNLLPVNVATDGVLTRSVRDTVAFYEALESQQSGRLAPIGPVAELTRQLRIGVFVDAPTGTPVHADHRGAAQAAGRLCASLGHVVEEIACPFEGRVIDDFLTYWGFVAWAQKVSARVLLHRRFDTSRLEPWSVGMARTFTAHPGAALAATRCLRGFGRRYAEVMTSYDVLVCPTVAHPAQRLGYLSAELPFETVFERLRAFAAFTPIQNVAGAPALTLPWGRSSEDVPVGVQLAAASGNDRLLLELGRAIEAARPWERVAPRRTSSPSR